MQKRDQRNSDEGTLQRIKKPTKDGETCVDQQQRKAPLTWSLGVVRSRREATGIGLSVAVKEGPSDGSCGHRKRSSPSRTRTQHRRG